MITAQADTAALYFVACSADNTAMHAGVIQQGQQVSTGLYALDCYATEADLLAEHPDAYDLLHPRWMVMPFDEADFRMLLETDANWVGTEEPVLPD